MSIKLTHSIKRPLQLLAAATFLCVALNAQAEVIGADEFALFDTGFIDDILVAQNGEATVEGSAFVGFGVDVQDEGVFNLNNDGGVSGGLRVRDEGIANVTGGTINAVTTLSNDAELNVSGGQVLSLLALNDESVLNIAGGQFFGRILFQDSQAEVNLFISELLGFKIGGVDADSSGILPLILEEDDSFFLDVETLELLADPLNVSLNELVLEVRFGDNTEQNLSFDLGSLTFNSIGLFHFAEFDGDIADDFESIPEPGTMMLGLIGIAAMSARQRHQLTQHHS